MRAPVFYHSLRRNCAALLGDVQPSLIEPQENKEKVWHEPVHHPIGKAVGKEKEHHREVSCTPGISYSNCLTGHKVKEKDAGTQQISSHSTVL